MGFDELFRRKPTEKHEDNVQALMAIFDRQERDIATCWPMLFTCAMALTAIEAATEISEAQSIARKALKECRDGRILSQSRARRILCALTNENARRDYAGTEPSM